MPQPELDYISIAGFKSIASIVKLKLSSVNLLIGANGSGKSNFIEAFSFLRSIREGGLQTYVRRAGGADEILHFGSKKTSEIKIEMSFCDQVNRYEITLKPNDEDTLFVADERVYYWDKSSYQKPWDDYIAPAEGGQEAGITKSSLGVSNWIRHRLEAWRVFHVHDTSRTSPLRKTAKLNDNEFFRADGSNLAAFLYLLQEQHKHSYDLIVGTVRRVAPYFKDFRLRPDRLARDNIRLSWQHLNSDKYFGVSSLSDGTLRFIALATLFLQPAELRPSVILVDEPELGLHPYAIGLLASLIKQAAPVTQVIISTQSSLLLDYFEPENVLVAERENDSTTLSRLSRGPLNEWLADYSLGQLWEKNEIGGRPIRSE